MAHTLKDEMMLDADFPRMVPLELEPSDCARTPVERVLEGAAVAAFSSSENSALRRRRLDVFMAAAMFKLSESLFFSKNSLTS